MTHAARKAERKRNRSKVSPQSTCKQAKAKLDYSDTPTMASSSMPVSSVTSTPGSRILSLGDIESRIARDHKDIKLTERDSNMIKVIVALIEGSLTESTNFINAGLQEEITAHKETQDKLNKLQKEHDVLEYAHNQLESKVVHLENQLLESEMNSMKHNVIISGISENNGKDESSLKRWLLVLIKDVYQKENINITSIHRTGRSRNNKPRDVVVTFADYNEKREFFKQRFNIKAKQKYKDIFIAEQFPHGIQEQRKVLNAVAKEARLLWPDLERNISVYQNVLYINNTRYKISDLHRLPKELQPIVHGYKENESTHVFFTKRSILSNHYLCDFDYNGQRYNCGEQLFMAEKARCFDDQHALRRILDSDSPVVQKAIGRDISGFNQRTWHEEVEEAIYPGLLKKFQNVTEAKEALLKTGNRALGEATKESPWGVGKTLADPDVLDQSKWSDDNLIGRVLTKIRETLKREIE